MHDTADIRRTLDELKHLGVRLAIDDFGTGYSSLSRLQSFPIDVIKIDRAFIDAIARNPSDLALVRSIHDLARALHIDTVAEGIEQLDQAQALQALGCPHGQGYYYAQPLTESAMSALLRARTDATPITLGGAATA